MLIAALVPGGNVRYAFSQSIDSANVTPGLRNAVALSIDPSGNVYVIDAGTSELVKFNREGRLIAKTGGYGWEDGTFDHPADVIAPNGLDVFVADYGNHRIQRFDRNLNFVSTFSNRQDEEQPIRFGYPRSVAQSRFGSLFIVDGENKRIVKISPDGTIERAFGDIGSGAGKLSDPRKVRVSSDDRVYVVDENSVVVFDIFGNYIGRSGTFARIRSLAICRDSICVVDSCAIYVLGKENALDRRHTPDVIDGGGDPCDIVDAQWQGGRQYVLTAHLVRRYQEPSDRMR